MEKNYFKSSSLMSNIVCQFATYKLKGAWCGSSHGYHPRGVLRNGICFQDDWNNNDYVWIYIGEDPDVEWTDAENSPRSFQADAEIRPKTGKRIRVWGFGRWEIEDENIRNKIINTFNELKSELIIAKQKKKEEEKSKQAKKAKEAQTFKDKLSNNWA